MKTKIKQLVRKHKTTIIWTGVGVAATSVCAALLVNKTERDLFIRKIDLYSSNTEDLMIVVFENVRGDIDSVEIPLFK